MAFTARRMLTLANRVFAGPLACLLSFSNCGDFTVATLCPSSMPLLPCITVHTIFVSLPVILSVIHKTTETNSKERRPARPARDGEKPSVCMREGTSCAGVLRQKLLLMVVVCVCVFPRVRVMLLNKMLKRGCLPFCCCELWEADWPNSPN